MGKIESFLKGNNAETAAPNNKAKDKCPVRRLRRFCLASRAIPFAIKTFLAMPEEEQWAGWCGFSRAIRRRLAAELHELIESLQALEQRVVELPGTKKIPGRGYKKTAIEPKETTTTVVELSGSATIEIPVFVWEKEKHPGKPARSERKPTVLPEKKEFTAAEVLVPELDKKTGQSPAKPELTNNKPLLAGWPPTANKFETAGKLLRFLLTDLQNGRRHLLSRRTLRAELWNGGPPENVDASALVAFRLVRDYWRASPDPDHPDVQKFIRLVSQTRHYLENLGSARFDDFIKVIRNRDNSSDPVSLERL